LGFFHAAETAQVLAKQIIGAADVAGDLLGIRNEADVFLESLDSQGEALGFGEDFSEIEIGERFARTETSGMQKGGFGSGKIAERHG
jgi:hypothetical protein